MGKYHDVNDTTMIQEESVIRNTRVISRECSINIPGNHPNKMGTLVDINSTTNQEGAGGSFRTCSVMGMREGILIMDSAATLIRCVMMRNSSRPRQIHHSPARQCTIRF